MNLKQLLDFMKLLEGQRQRLLKELDELDGRYEALEEAFWVMTGKRLVGRRVKVRGIFAGKALPPEGAWGTVEAVDSTLGRISIEGVQDKCWMHLSLVDVVAERVG